MIRSGVVVTLSATQPEFDTQSPSAPVTSSSAQALSWLTIQLDTLVGCGSCSAAGGCGIQLLPSANKPIQIHCPLPQQRQIRVGEKVRVRIPEPSQGWLMLVLKAYGWPTAGMLGGAITGFLAASLLNVSQHQELMSVAGFALGLAGGLLAWDKTNKSGCPMQASALVGEPGSVLTGELLPPFEDMDQEDMDQQSVIHGPRILKQENKT